VALHPPSSEKPEWLRRRARREEEAAEAEEATE